jgi:DNA-directed RNA polymerase
LSQPDLLAIERQKFWEVEGINRGVRRFREQMRDGGLMAVAPGKEAAADVIRSMIPAIDRAKHEAINLRKKTNWAYVIQAADSDVLAAITVNGILSHNGPNNMEYARPWTAVCLGIANNLHVQIEFDDWVAQQRADKKLARKEGREFDDLFERYRRTVKRFDVRSWRGFQRKVSAIRTEPWSTTDKVAIGHKLLHLAVTNGGGWFEARRIAVKGKTQRFIDLTAPARIAIEDLTRRAELARPMRVPMIAPPRPWIEKEPHVEGRTAEGLHL